MAIALIALLLVEVLLLLFWAPFFFRTGIVLTLPILLVTLAALAIRLSF